MKKQKSDFSRIGNKMAKTAWMKFLAEYYKKHKGSKSYKQCMVDAAKEYKASKGKSAEEPKKKKRRVKRKRAVS